jgi:hypothetical protein
MEAYDVRKAPSGRDGGVDPSHHFSVAVVGSCGAFVDGGSPPRRCARSCGTDHDRAVSIDTAPFSTPSSWRSRTVLPALKPQGGRVEDVEVPVNRCDRVHGRQGGLWTSIASR